MFTAAQVTIAKTWEKLKCLSTNEWIKKMWYRSSHCGTAETNPTRNREVADSIPGLAQLVMDLALLWAVV